MGELRDEIARTIADSIRVNFHSANGLHVAELMGDALAAADRILAIPRLQEALQLVHAINTMPEGMVVTAAKRDWIDDSPPKSAGPPISTNTKGT